MSKIDAFKKRMPLAFVIVAAGSSSRFGEEKQTLLLRGLPVFLHSVRTFLPVVEEMVIAVPPGRIGVYKTLAEKHGIPSVDLHWVEGGATRSESVRNALGTLSLQEGMVAIHDAARPLATVELLFALLDLSAGKTGAVPAGEVRDTLLKSDADGCMTGVVDRANCWYAQTPQVFPLAKLREAYSRLNGKSFTDDTQVFRAAGETVRILPWAENNLKLTYREDLSRAEEELERRNG